MRNKRVIEQWIQKEDGTGFEIVQAGEEGAGDLAQLPGPDQLPARPARAQIIVEGSYSDRAKGFSIATWQLSTVVAVAAVVLSKAMLAYPLLSVATVAWLVSGYFVVWFGAFLMHTFVSAEGAEFLETVFHWIYLQKEQRERHRRHGAPMEAPAWRGALRDMLIAGGVVVLALVVLGIVIVIGGVQ